MRERRFHISVALAGKTASLRNQRGLSLILAIFLGMVLSSIGYITLHEIVTDLKTTGNYAQMVQAYWLAEAGMERTFRYLRFANPPPGGVAPITFFNQEPAGSGTYTVIIDPDDENPSNYIKRYKITATGTVGDVTRTLEAYVKTSTFGKYAYLSGDEGGSIWFTTGDLIEGPLHSNDQISIVGSPVFKGKVTSSASTFVKGSPFNPDFQDGYQLGIPPITFPKLQTILDNYLLQNGNTSPLTIDARFNRDAKIVFNPDGTLTYSVWQYNWWGGVTYLVKDKVVSISSLNGMLLVKGDVEIEGKMKGQLTLVATNNIYITNDLVYADSDASGRPDPNSMNMLGLVSTKNIVVAYTTPNLSDVKINGALLALGDSFTVEYYQYGSPRGKLTLYGSLSQKVRGPVGTFNSWGIQTGYQKDYHYDNRLLNMSPPYFPITGQYEVYSWREVEQ